VIRPRPAWQEFRAKVLGRLDELGDPDRFEFLDADRCVHGCPACHSRRPNYLAVWFVGDQSAVDLYCSRGCSESLIAAALGLEVVA
jgi:hypothetical protein